MPQRRALGPWPEHVADVGVGFESGRSIEKAPMKQLYPTGIRVLGWPEPKTPQRRALRPWPEHFADVGAGFEPGKSSYKRASSNWYLGFGGRSEGPRLSIIGDPTARKGLFCRSRTSVATYINIHIYMYICIDINIYIYM